MLSSHSSFSSYHSEKSKGFTLIELLVVIAIIAILSVVVILTLNPAELLRQSRDSSRVSDMATLSSALGIYAEDVGGGMGSPNVVYVSIPDPSATSTAGDQCQGLGLISLPSLYSYHCAASSTYRNVDGTGWIPVNFKSISSGAPVGSLPIDPFNTSSSRLYYTYTTDGTQYEVTSGMESSKYTLGGSNDVISSDGGPLASVYEKGSKLGLEPLDYGDPSLVGLWTFDEGSGTFAYDYSGNNNNGTLSSPSPTWVPGKIGSGALSFNGANSSVVIPNSSSTAFTGPVTMASWFYETDKSNYRALVAKGNTVSRSYAYYLNINSTNAVYYGSVGALTLSTGWLLNTWNYLVLTDDGININIYLNGSNVYSHTGGVGATLQGQLPVYIGLQNGGLYPMAGLIDDVRVYNRALSAAEIKAIYNAQK